MRFAHLLNCSVYPVSNLAFAHRFELLAEGRYAIRAIFERPVVNVPEDKGFPVPRIRHRVEIPERASSFVLFLREQMLFRVEFL